MIFYGEANKNGIEKGAIISESINVHPPLCQLVLAVVFLFLIVFIVEKFV